MSEKSTWIPISERMPSPCTPILFCLESSPTVQYGYWSELRAMWSSFSAEGDQHFHHEDVTRWMELPEVPEGMNND